MHGVIRETVWIPGATRLSGELAYPTHDECAACLLVPPHPYMGGRMDNNVIAALAASLPESGIVALRFDYSGVGASDGAAIDVPSVIAAFWASGHAPADSMFVDDASRALSWLAARSSVPLFVAGYSFGAFAAARIARQELRGLVLISPTLSQHPLEAPPVPGVPTLLIYSGADFATDLRTTTEWLERCSGSVRSLCMTGDRHFHVGREQELSAQSAAFMHGVLAESGAPA